MEWFLSVSDHIVELTPNWQTFPDGSKLEVSVLIVMIWSYVGLFNVYFAIEDAYLAL